ncbi:MAG: hypothetical protein A2041_05665 [Bacteroidetes bacterium GWA2_31_9b]|nr:MAG: hypothetical protein A2041_05665 [Bacteroidetes bacterium GWA2_31_9b]
MKISLRVKALFFIFTSLFILFALLVLYSEAAEGGADNYAHYRLARYAFRYPHFFLDHWGKPLFTILSSPFAQFGFKGIQFFNVIAGLLTAFFAYLTVRKLEYTNTWLVILFTCFTPVYFILMLSGLTEILFSLILVFSIYLFFDKRFIASSIVISFIILSRTEGIVILPLFLAGFILEKKYRAIPFLLSGFLIFSLLGFFILDDFLWFITQNPYSGAKEIYGTGKLTHFINSTKLINGIPLATLAFIGIISWIIDFIRYQKKRKQITLESLIILGSYFIYLTAHSIAWWKGVGGSLGLIRVMAAVMPVAAILSLRGFNLIFDLFKFKQILQLVVKIVVIVFVIKLPFQIYKVPVKLDGREELIDQAADWVKDNNLTEKKIYYYDLFFIHQLGVNPFDQNRCFEKIPDISNPGLNMPEGSILQWDAQFGPNEGQLPLDSLLQNPRFEILKSFKPDESFKVLNGYDYEVYIFQRTSFI